MGKIKKIRVKIKKYFAEQPKMIVPAAIFLFIVVLSGVEFVRASIYISKANEYKESAKVSIVVDSASKLSYQSEYIESSTMCSINLDDLIAKSNQAYIDPVKESNDPEIVMKELSNLVKQAAPSPEFNSIMQFIPRVYEARKISRQMESSLYEIAKLTKQDGRSMYCSNVAGVLSEIYFIDDLSKPEAVSALHVGQVENFQVNSQNALDAISKIEPPEEFVENHKALVSLVSKLKGDLKNNTNDYVGFSRVINENLKVLKTELEDLKQKSVDLQSRPQEILLRSSLLQ